MKSKKEIFSIAVGILAIGAVHANLRATPVVTYTLSINDNGSGVYTAGDFAIYLSDTLDNGGIVAATVGVTGATSVKNMMPKGVYDDGTGTGNTLNEGFTTLRSSNFTTAPTSTFDLQETVYGSQDLPQTPPTNVPIYGFGQTAGNLNNDAPSGSTGGFEKVQPVYGSPLLMATGTYNGVDGSLFFTPGPSGTPSNPDPIANEGANVYQSDTSTQAIPANLALVTNTLSSVPVPEPATMALFALGGLGILTLGRKRKQA